MLIYTETKKFQNLNTVAFLFTAASSYQGAIRGIPWLGLAVFTLFAALAFPGTSLKKERFLVMAIGGAGGFLLDTLLILAGVYAPFPHTRVFLAAPLCPDWILSLWLNFAFMMYFFSAFLGKSKKAPVIVGLVFAFLVYSNASRLGLLDLGPSRFLHLSLIAVAWAVAIPFFAAFTSSLLQKATVENETMLKEN
jgi:hypothetical protein